MATDKSDSSQPAADKGPSMKERLLAQRKAQAAAAGTPAADPKMAAAAAKPAGQAPARSAAIAERTGGASAAAQRIHARRGGQHHTELSPDVQREVQLLKARENKTMTYVWIVCGVLFLAAAGVLGNTLMQRAREERERLEWEAKLDALKAEVVSKEATKEVDAKLILEIGGKSENKQLYKNTRIEGDIARAMSVAQRTIDNATERADLQARLEGVEKVASGEGQGMEAIRTARRTAVDLNEKASIMDEAFKKRLTEARDKIDKAYLVGLMKDAKDKGQTREALTAFTLAEVEIRDALDNTLRGSKDTERKKWYTDLFKQLVTDSDAAAVAVFNDAYVEGQAWRDALTKDETKNWQKSGEGISGFNLNDGLMQVVGPKAGSGKLGVISIGDKERLKDFVAHFEFTPLKGNVDFYFRLYNRADNNTPSYNVRTIGNGAEFKPGQSYSMDMKIIGSSLSTKFPNTDLPAFEETVSPNKQRFGAIGIVFSEDSEVKFTSFKFKELRSIQKK